MCAILRLTRMKNEREPKDAWTGINALYVLRMLTKMQGRTAYMADLPCPVGSTTKVSFPETNETTVSFCLDFNLLNDSFLVASERALYRRRRILCCHTYKNK